MSNISFNCDVCGRQVQGCTFVNGMKFCAKCYQETFGNKNMTENLNNMYEGYLKILNEKAQRIADLERQLAEKDERIRKLHLEAQEYYEDAYCNDFQDKAKADFAIKQIQKAWDMFSEEYFANEKMETLGTRFLARLDQQIQELRGQE